MAAPRFEKSIQPRAEHIDTMGHVNNVVYLQWVQDTAEAHWSHLASHEEQKNFLWVVLRHEIDYVKPAFAGDAITGITWVESTEGARSIRRVELRRGDEILVKARTTWVTLDPLKGRPQRVPTSLARKFLGEDHS